jgi:hypothetical protein
MPPERRRLALLLAILAVVIAVAAYRFWPESVQIAGGRAAARPGARASAPSTITAPDVQLQALNEERPKPVASPRRNLFRFKPKAPPAPPPAARQAASNAATQNGPPGPPPLAPIPMRFIGIVEAPERAEKVAVLTDGRGIYHGHEGDIIEGRYRLLRIGAESVDMAYLDGRGRQTIRLSGS